MSHIACDGHRSLSFEELNGPKTDCEDRCNNEGQRYPGKYLCQRHVKKIIIKKKNPLVDRNKKYYFLRFTTNQGENACPVFRGPINVFGDKCF